MHKKFLIKSYNDLLTLISEAKDFIDSHKKPDSLQISTIDYLKYCRETVRLSSRCSKMLEWFHAHKIANHLSTDNSEHEVPDLKGSSFQTKINTKDTEKFPKEFSDLIQRCENLYHRIIRIDQMMNSEVNVITTVEEPAVKSRSLQNDS